MIKTKFLQNRPMNHVESNTNPLFHSIWHQIISRNPKNDKIMRHQIFCPILNYLVLECHQNGNPHFYLTSFVNGPLSLLHFDLPGYKSFLSEAISVSHLSRGWRKALGDASSSATPSATVVGRMEPDKHRFITPRSVFSSVDFDNVAKFSRDAEQRDAQCSRSRWEWRWLAKRRYLI